TIAILRNDGTGTFEPLREVTVAGEPYWLVASDLDGDGDIDLAITGNKSPKITVLWNDGAAELVATSVFFGFNSHPGYLGAADIDRDGMPDLLASHFIDTAAQVSALINKGNGKFAAPRPLLVGPAVGSHSGEVFTVADLDGDDDLDLVVNDSRVF